VEFFRYQYPKLLLFHIPNAGKRNIVEGARLKRMGMLQGVPDIFLAVPNRTHAGLFIELKWGKNTMTESQQRIQQQLLAAGYEVGLVRSVDDFQKLVTQYLANRQPSKSRGLPLL
jgi:hypothetical protein